MWKISPNYRGYEGGGFYLRTESLGDDKVGNDLLSLERILSI